VALSVGETPIVITAADLRDIDRLPILPVYTADGSVAVLPETGIDELPGSPAGDRGISVTPNPSSGRVVVEFLVAPGDLPVAVDVMDVRGRIVAHPRGLVLNDRAGRVVWSGRGDRGESLPSGVYFVVVRAGVEAHRAKCVVLR
jgi:hypothetical protein